MKTQQALPTLLEAAWEVCNKVGGIHTVITSKLSRAQDHFKDNYLLIGPWVGEQQRAVFREEAIPVAWESLVKELEKRGVGIHYGTWLLPEEPHVMLLSWDRLVGQLDTLKGTLWETHRLDTLGTNFYDVDQPLLWSQAVGMVADAFAEIMPVILHAHEWMAGASIFTARNPELHTVFTTHATVLGRALSSQDIFIYDKFGVLKPDDEARRLNVTAKHQIERLSAQSATIFTTVSSITAEEATAFLGRTPEVITQNGLRNADILDYETLVLQRTAARKVADDFVAATFFPSYRFDLSKTRYQFTMGRYELHNKGYDTYIESLGELNKRLVEEGRDETVVAFILVPADVLRLRPEAGTQLTVFRQMQQLIRQHLDDAPAALYKLYWDRNTPQTPLPADLDEALASISSHLPKVNQPAISPYDLRTGDDAMTNLIRSVGLTNSAENRVKVVYLPIYLDGFDGIFNAPLYTLISGYDLGVFPSLYEPWGYTPMESILMGVPAITSNLAGFGKALIEEKLDIPGSLVLDRNKNDKNTERTALTKLLWESTIAPRTTLSRERFAAHETAFHFGWDRLYSRYLEAYKQL